MNSYKDVGLVEMSASVKQAVGGREKRNSRFGSRAGGVCPIAGRLKRAESGPTSGCQDGIIAEVNLARSRPASKEESDERFS